MKKQEVLETLCKLAREVNANVFNFAVAADCFCTEKNLSGLGLNFEFNPEVIEFIQAAVRKEIARRNN